MSSDLKVTNIKHESSSSNNLVLASDGNVSITNTLSAGTLGSSVVVPASIGGGEVLLGTFTSSSNIIAITGMSTTYTTYKFIATGLKADTNSIHVYWFLKKADGTVRSSAYEGGRMRVYYNGSGTGNDSASFADTLFGNDSDLQSGETYNGIFYVFNPASATLHTHGVGVYNYVNDSSYNIALRSGCHYTTAEAHTAINLQTQSGNWTSGTVRMYGIK
jgi:hypothetical protein